MPKPAWSLTDRDVERMIAVFARVLAVALADELRRSGVYVVRDGDDVR